MKLKEKSILARLGRTVAIPGLVLLAVCASLAADSQPQAEPWLKQRLDWFQDQKFGLMMHWGVYSEWGSIESWPLVEDEPWARPDDLPAWNERGRNLERFKRDYIALARSFNPTNFAPADWARVAKAAGMKYVVFTTKHHDGFCLFDTKLTDYRVTAPEVPFHSNARSNVTREVFSAFRKEGLGIGAYFSKADWHSPYYWSPNWPARTRNPNYDTHAHPELWSNFVAFTQGQLEELMCGYGPIDILWLDAGQVRPPDQDIQMERIATMARHYQPRLILVDRTVGGRFENYCTPEQQVPDKPLPSAWETCMCLGMQWGFKPNDTYKSTHEVIHLLVDIVGKGGNLLLNVGPQPDGQLPPVAQERLAEIGAWLKVNGEAVYGTRPVAPYKEDRVLFTKNRKHAYAIYLAEKNAQCLPARIVISGLKPKTGSKLQLIGTHQALPWHTLENGTTIIELPLEVRQSPPCRHAVAFRFEAIGR